MENVTKITAAETRLTQSFKRDTTQHQQQQQKLFQLDIHTHRLLKTPQRFSATRSSHSDAACSQTWLIVYDLFNSLQKLQTWKEENYAFFVPTKINHTDINYATARPEYSTQQLHPGQATVNSHDVS